MGDTTLYDPTTHDPDDVVIGAGKGARQLSEITSQLADDSLNVHTKEIKGDYDGTNGTDNGTAINNLFSSVLNSSILFPQGRYFSSIPIVFKSGVRIKTSGKVSIEVNCTGEYAFLMDSLQNVTVDGELELIRFGNVGKQGDNSCLVIKGTCDNTVVLDKVKAFNNTTPITGQTIVNAKGIHIYGSASPILRNVEGYGGTSTTDGAIASGLSTGGSGGGSPSPIVFNSQFYGGTGGGPIGIETDATEEGVHSRFFNCKGFGGTGWGATGLQVDDIDHSFFFNCEFYGKSALGDANNQACHGLIVFAAASPIFEGCYAKGAPSNGSQGIKIENGSPIFKNTTAENGAWSSCYGWHITGNAYPELLNCHNKLPSKPFRYNNVAGTSQSVVLNADYSTTIKTMDLVVLNPVAGATINIGTTAGGSDIASGVSLATAGWQNIAIPLSITRTKMAANSQIYLTPSVSIPAYTYQISGVLELVLPSSDGMYLNSKGIKAKGLHLVASQGNAAFSIDTVALTANWTELFNCSFETLRTQTGAQEITMRAYGAWNSPRIYGCVIDGTTSNITLPTGANFVTT